MRQVFGGLLIFATISVASAGEGDIAKGVGVVACDEFFQAYSKDPQYIQPIFFSWAQGFMTAMNVSTHAKSNMFKDLDGNIEDQQAYIRSYCIAPTRILFRGSNEPLFDITCEVK